MYINCKYNAVLQLLFKISRKTVNVNLILRLDVISFCSALHHIDFIVSHLQVCKLLLTTCLCKNLNDTLCITTVATLSHTQIHL